MMLREKIDTLKSKNYTITKITTNAVIYDNESLEVSYFSKEIYKEDKGFSNKYYSPYSPFSTSITPRHKIKKIMTKLTTRF